MSDLVYQNYNNRCQGWNIPNNLSFAPQITNLSSYQSPAGSSTVVAITGLHFYSYSTISFGTFNPTVYFVNSNLLQFYVPNTLKSGTFPLQVFNASIGSNIVNYTIDNASGYWLLNSNGSISNTNLNGLNVSWLSVGAPVILTNNPLNYTLSNPYIIPNNVSLIITSNDGGTNPFYLKLPTGTEYIGRQITIQAQGTLNVLSINNNIIPLGSPTSITNNIIVQGYVTQTNWSNLVNYNGNNWIIMTANWQ